MSEENQQFDIQKIYLKDVSFESPNSPLIFTQGEVQPSINIQLNSNYTAIAENVYEVVLDVTVTSKVEDSTAFLVEVKQAGIFKLVGFPQENLAGMLGAYCPETLFPFAREAVSELLSKGGFPQLLLAPVNFNALFTEQMKKQQEAAGQATGSVADSATDQTADQGATH
jgi:preprotein translocase subunit SecB